MKNTKTSGGADLLLERALLRSSELPPLRAHQALRATALYLASQNALTPERHAQLNAEYEAIKARAGDPGRN